VIYFETLGSISDFAPELLVGQDGGKNRGPGFSIAFNASGKFL
jgi:hypothetical protein